MRESYKLESFFKSLLDRSYFPNHGIRIVQEPANFNEIIHHYDQLLKDVSRTSIWEDYINIDSEIEFIALHGQLYTQTMNMADDDFYTIMWDIRKTESIINRDIIKPTILPLEELFIDAKPRHHELTRDYLAVSLKNNAPIIAAWFPMVESRSHVVVIDGNHRVYSKYKAGQQQIPAYILNPNQHTEAMIGDIHRYLFAVFNNITWIFEYMAGYYDLDTAVQRMVMI